MVKVVQGAGDGSIVDELALAAGFYQVGFSEYAEVMGDGCVADHLQ